MKKTILQMIIALIVILIQCGSNCYAAGGTLSLSQNTVKPGETVELSIILSTESIGYDLNISTSNSDLIASSELVSNLDKGNTSRIYMIQIAAESDRKVYSAGTKIATIKYKIADTAKAGDKIVFTVSGDVVGKNSSEKNSMNESVTLTVGEKTSTPTPTPTATPTSTPTPTVTPTSTPTPTGTPTTVPTPTSTPTPTGTPTTVPTSTSTPTSTGGASKNTGKLPNAGDKGIVIIGATVVIMGIGLIALRQYRKMRIK